jgi:hypothetical protein
MLTAWTNYPISPGEFGRGRDFAGRRAPVRAVTILTYDRDKRCKVRIAGFAGIFEIKLGYIYPRPGRCGSVQAISHQRMCAMTRPILSRTALSR